MSDTLKTIACVSRTTLCEQIKELILAQLKKGELRPGDKLPAGEELARSLGVSAGTVRRAMEELVSEKILVRRQGSGTFVSSYRQAGYWNRFQNFQKSDGRLIVWRSKTIEAGRVPAPAAVAHAFGIAPGSGVIRALRHMFDSESGSLVGVDQLYLHPGHFPDNAADRLLEPLPQGESLYQFYERAFGVAVVAAGNVLSAFVCSRQLDEALGKPGLEGKVLFQIVRIGRTYGHAPVEYRIELTDASQTRIGFD